MEIACRSFAKITAHLGRAKGWKRALLRGRLYPRTSAKTERKLSLNALCTMLIPVEAGKFVELTMKKKDSNS